MSNPQELQYTRTHEWMREEDGVATIGITDFAQKELGDLVFINLPVVGDSVRAGEALADVESVKAVSDIISPVSGTILEVNEELADKPEKINQAPYEAWIARVGDINGREETLDAQAYDQHVKGV